jgi:hypothetical protein
MRGRAKSCASPTIFARRTDRARARRQECGARVCGGDLVSATSSLRSERCLRRTTRDEARERGPGEFHHVDLDALARQLVAQRRDQPIGRHWSGNSMGNERVGTKATGIRHSAVRAV